MRVLVCFYCHGPQSGLLTFFRHPICVPCLEAYLSKRSEAFAETLSERPTDEDVAYFKRLEGIA